MKITVSYCINKAIMRRQRNKNACGESTYNIEGLAFASQSFLSTPAPSLKNSFCFDQSKNCVVHTQPHKKRVDNSLICGQVNGLRSFKGRVALYISKCII